MNTKQLILTFCLMAVAAMGVAQTQRATNLQVGSSSDSTETTFIGAVTGDSTAILQINSTTKGFLPPRMTTTERDAIQGPALGLTIYNTNINCVEVFRGTWKSTCLSDALACISAPVSITPCSSVSGATANDDAATTEGTEYNWTGANTSGMANTSTTRALVDIGGQCWMRYNMDVVPSSFSPAPTPVSGIDNGWSGYYTAGPHTDEGLLYQWSAAMNNSTTEGAQGVCPTDWHVPSDCEWMYLESTLGMSIRDQGVTLWRTSGTVGSDLSTVTASGNNNSGFSALLGGFRGSDGSYRFRNTLGNWWSSSATSASSALNRRLFTSNIGSYRYSDLKGSGYSVRCLKN